MLVAPCFCSRAPGDGQGQAFLRPATRDPEEGTAAGTHGPLYVSALRRSANNGRAAMEVKPTWLPARGSKRGLPRTLDTEPKPRSESVAASSAALYASKQASCISSTTRAASLLPEHLPPRSLCTITCPSLHRSRHLPFPFGFRWRRELLSVSPSTHSCTTHPRPPAVLHHFLAHA
jgi:hypothetical protein